MTMKSMESSVSGLVDISAICEPTKPVSVSWDKWKWVYLLAALDTLQSNMHSATEKMVCQGLSKQLEEKYLLGLRKTPLTS